jgi:hypothetical protein
VDGLKENAALRAAQTRTKAEEAIAALAATEGTINFKSVAEAAGISTAWLYAHPDIKERIAHLRGQQMLHVKPRPSVSVAERRSDASKDAIITHLKDRLKRVEAENKELRMQLEVAYGRFLEQP